MRTWILIDATYICHRAFHSTGNLSFDEEPTGVIYGFLRDLENLRKRFASERLVFTWDHGKGLREQRYTFYKESRRKNNSEENVKKHEILQPQIEKLKTAIIPQIGYKNNFMQVGYEADDLIASIVQDNRSCNDDFVIVTGDQDMYQLIQSPEHASRSTAIVYHPREDRIVNHQSFFDEYGVQPKDWIKVKALAGCSSDEIPGLTGVGEKTAASYWSGHMKPTHNKLTAIKEFLKTKQAAQNLLLVRLPYKGVKEMDLRDDARDEKAYRKLLSSMGIQTL